MAHLQFVDFPLMLGPVRKEKNLWIDDDFCQIDVTNSSRMSHKKGVLRKTRWQRQRERHQTIGLMSNTMAVHVHYNFSVHFFAVLCKTAS